MRDWRSLPVRSKQIAVLSALVVGLAAIWLALELSGASATPPQTTTPPPQPSAADAPVPAAAPTPGAGSGEVPAIPTPVVPSTTATIVFQTIPAAYATVTWGRKTLGRIGPKQPLVIPRPRDSGPLDVVVRAQGFLPVSTRAHTF